MSRFEKTLTTPESGGGTKKDATILNTGIVCSRTIPASAVRGLRFDREFQRPPSFQPYIGSGAGELPRTLAVSQGRNLILSSKMPCSKNYSEMIRVIRDYNGLII